MFIVVESFASRLLDVKCTLEGRIRSSCKMTSLGCKMTSLVDKQNKLELGTGLVETKWSLSSGDKMGSVAQSIRVRDYE